MIKKVIYSIFIFVVLVISSYNLLNASNEEERIEDYKELRDINYGTFNEYGYRITEQFFKLKQDFEVNGTFQKSTLSSIEKLALEGYKHLPDNLNNKKYLNDLQSALKKGEKTNNELIYIEIARAIEKYLYNTEIKKITGNIEANPTSGNAPLNATLRARVTDPTGTIIPKDNYIWWVDDGGKKKVVGKGLSINYTLNSEGKFSIFLDVLSDHRNSSNYIDVLPFRSRADIEVKQKVANVNIKVNFTDLGLQQTLKISPEDGDYGIVFDATSSTPTSGSKFLKTTWDFGNGIKRENEGGPKVERVVYANKGDYTVKLKLKTNELQEVERKFVLSINNPIATILASQEQGFIGDRFTFSAKTSTTEKNINYNWEIVDIERNQTVLEKAGSLFTYEFSKKGKFNVKLKVISPSGEVDNDNKIIYINSRAPISDFGYSIPNPSSPNKVLFDATKSYDEDYTDEGKLEYSWEIDGQKIELENPKFNGAIGYYTFDYVGEHSVVLEITDPDGIKSLKKEKIKIESILSVSFDATPLVIKRNSSIKFIGASKEAKFYRWDFGDGLSEGLQKNEISHTYTKSGIFTVKLEVSDEMGNINTFSRNVYVSDSQYPFALIDVSYENGFSTPFDSNGCDGKGAYIIDRIENVKFSGQKSINIDGTVNGITYSWKIGQENVSSNSMVIKKFDEIGCFPIKLSVKSDKNDKIHVSETYVQVKNILPSLTSLSVQAVDTNSDPIIVNLKAIGDKDKDGVILSYLWYYYTDADEEPQDYRVTAKPETTFVLPKISGTYYFVLTLKDNNEDKYSSENLGTKFYVTLVGDNVNTPLVDLTVNDSSVSVGDQVEFTTKIKNVLGQDLTSKTTYSWDFNGDGFYDKEVTGNGTITHKFENSGSFHVKVKAKYKGISNVKSVTVDVVNTIVPDFDYISIYNKTIFLNKTLGKYDDVSWDLGDGNISDSKNSFSHTYYDGKSVHKVTLRVSEGNKYKEVSRRIVRNTENIKKAYKKGLNIFSKPEISGSGQIILKNKNEKVFLYLAESKLDVAKYSIDFDIDYDSDLNGGKTDDEDNKDTPSFRSGDPVEVILNENTKKQIVRVILYDSKGSELAKQDIEITKEYIIEEKTEKDIKFTGISKTDEEKVNALKNYIAKFPQNYRVIGMKYLERLQSEWFDETEKTKVILEFEGFVDNPEIPNSTEIINLLESILIEGEEDKSQKNIALSALKNLLLKNIQCEYDTKTFKSCKEYLVSILEEIKNSTDIEKNKELGKTILAVIAKDTTMTTKEKEDFKEILQILVYGENTYETTKEVPVEAGFFSKLLSFLKWIAMIVMFLIVIIGLVILGFWLYFKFVFKDNSKTFEEFIIDKTKLKKQDNDITEAPIKKEQKNDTTIEEVIKDPFSMDTESPAKENIKEEKIPDWLKASFEQNGDAKSEDNNNIKQDTVIKENKTILSQNIENIQTEDEKAESTIEEKSNDNTNDSKVEAPSNVVETKSELEATTPENDLTKIDDPDIPDWLKG
ncbi:PKD domain-containing protein, partial [Candidatus Gracilibacteria bacterium]|nr:PKD domain-containing protein [Candidatus Gracilibacteria bacterium]